MFTLHPNESIFVKMNARINAKRLSTCKNHTPTVVQGGNPPICSVFVTLRYFEKFLSLIDSVLCRLQDDVNIMGYICK